MGYSTVLNVCVMGNHSSTQRSSSHMTSCHVIDNVINLSRVGTNPTTVQYSQYEYQSDNDVMCSIITDKATTVSSIIKKAQKLV